MTSINPINVNTQGVGGFYGYGEKPKTEEKETKEAEVSVNAEKTQLPADKVLEYMAQSAISIAPKTVDPSKYVDEESKARIAGFMAEFEDIVAANLKAISDEFPGMSESAQQALALSQVQA